MPGHGGARDKVKSPIRNSPTWKQFGSVLLKIPLCFKKILCKLVESCYLISDTWSLVPNTLYLILAARCLMLSVQMFTPALGFATPGWVKARSAPFSLTHLAMAGPR